MRRLLQSATPYFTAVDDPDADPKAVALLQALGKESDIAVPIVVDGRGVGGGLGQHLPRWRRASARATCASWRRSPGSSRG